MNRWVRYDLGEIFREFEIWVTAMTSPFNKKLHWMFQIRWPNTTFNIAPEFEDRIYFSPRAGLEDVRNWIRSQQTIRNPDDKLRRLERAAQTGDHSAWMQWYYELERVGQLEDFINSFSDSIVDVVLDLNNAIRTGGAWMATGYGVYPSWPAAGPVTIEGRTGPVMVTIPPPFERALQLAELTENSYYISPHSHHAPGVGYGEIKASELAMHLGVVDNEILQYYLQGGAEQVSRVQGVAVDSISSGGELVTSQGPPSEILSDEIRREIGWSNPQIPELTPEHQPMLIYKLVISDHQGIFRARIHLYHYLRDNVFYRRWEGDDYERNRLLPIIDQVLIEQHGYLEA